MVAFSLQIQILQNLFAQDSGQRANGVPKKMLRIPNDREAIRYGLQTPQKSQGLLAGQCGSMTEALLDRFQESLRNSKFEWSTNIECGFLGSKKRVFDDEQTPKRIRRRSATIYPDRISPASSSPEFGFLESSNNSCKHFKTSVAPAADGLPPRERTMFLRRSISLRQPPREPPQKESSL